MALVSSLGTDQLDPTNAAANITGDLTPGAPRSSAGPVAAAPYTPPAQGYTSATPGASQVVANPANAAGRGVSPQQYYNDYLQNFGLNAKQSMPTSLQPLVDAMRTEGYNATLAAPSSGGYVKGIMLNGQFVKLLDGSDNPIWDQNALAADGGSAGGGVFSDPATTQWETALNALVSKLNQPQQTQDYSGVTDYMRQYMQQLQQPGYTPAQLDTLQTQALDPLTQQRDAQQQQLMQRFAAQGLGPSSGIVQKAIQDLNTQFQRIRSTTQGQFATNVISNDQQRQGQALQVGSQLQNLEQATAANDENRAAQAVNLLYQIPQLADTRLTLANQTLGQQTSPTSLLTNAAQFQQLGQNAQNQMANYITSLIQGLYTS